MRRARLLVLSLWFGTAPVLVVASGACGHDDPEAPGPKPITGTDDASTADTRTTSDVAVADTAVDAPDAPDTAEASVVVRCSADELAAGDHTSDVGTIGITFPMVAGPAQYAPNCITVKQNAMVTFTGNFTSHPLEPNGGDMPTPIPLRTSSDPGNNTLLVVMSTVGTYGYECMIHPGVMFGAIRVVP